MRRAGFVPGLVLLVLAHLTANVHSASFDSPSFDAPHVAVELGRCPHSGTVTGHGAEPAPEHRHDAHGHLSHAVDRPRVSGGNTASGAALHLLPLAPVLARLSALTPAIRSRPPEATAASDEDDTLTLHCVWRQ
ncbi:hypothetical protein [Streptomyces sp. NPDC046805]|uniref:hypothetical protein n=1 Tax=Streptomyces sp. NPDC046805 TaxID=3155134 RepID=UPI0033E862B0